jgi:hypothetical protein
MRAIRYRVPAKKCKRQTNHPFCDFVSSSETRVIVPSCETVFPCGNDIGNRGEPESNPNRDPEFAVGCVSIFRFRKAEIAIFTIASGY